MYVAQLLMDAEREVSKWHAKLLEEAGAHPDGDSVVFDPSRYSHRLYHSTFWCAHPFVLVTHLPLILVSHLCSSSLSVLLTASPGIK